MSFIKLQRFCKIQNVMVKGGLNRNYANDATKTSTATVSTSSAKSTGFTIPGTAGSKDETMPPPPLSQVKLSSDAKPEVSPLVNQSTSGPIFNTTSITTPLTQSTTIEAPVITPDIERTTVPFDDMPGPVMLKTISKIWSVIPLVGTQITATTVQYMLSAPHLFGSQLKWTSFMWIFKRLLDEYGPIVRLHGPFGGDVVIFSRPEHAKALFQSEGPYPIRSSLDSIEKYRLKYRRFKKAGPFLMYGPEWEKLRRSVEVPLQTSVTHHFNKIDKTCDDFIQRIITIRNRQEEVPPNFKDEIYKWSMECLCSVTLNRRLGFLDPCGLSATSDPGRLLEGLMGATAALRQLEYGFHLYKYMRTPAWKSLVRNCDAIDSVLNKFVQRAQEALRLKKADPSLDRSQEMSFLENMLLREGILAEDVMTVLLDMILIGVNATSRTVAFLLYHLARSPRSQVKIYEELRNKPAQLTQETLQSMQFLQACIKESLRLKPPLPVLNRVLNRDIIVDNYRIPKGTYVLMATHLSSLREEHFEDPLKYKPERWLNQEDGMINRELQAFATIPFGHGPKACLAKELAEMQMALLITKLIRRFRIEYHYGDIDSTNKLLAPPNRPLKFRFVDRV